MKTAVRNSAAFRAYIQLRLDEESDMKAVLLKARTSPNPKQRGNQLS